jgi:hypothetical protein
MMVSQLRSRFAKHLNDFHHKIIGDVSNAHFSNRKIEEETIDPCLSFICNSGGGGAGVGGEEDNA